MVFGGFALFLFVCFCCEREKARGSVLREDRLLFFAPTVLVLLDNRKSLSLFLKQVMCDKGSYWN